MKKAFRAVRSSDFTCWHKIDPVVVVCSFRLTFKGKWDNVLESGKQEQGY